MDGGVRPFASGTLPVRLSQRRGDDSPLPFFSPPYGEKAPFRLLFRAGREGRMVPAATPFSARSGKGPRLPATESRFRGKRSAARFRSGTAKVRRAFRAEGPSRTRSAGFPGGAGRPRRAGRGSGPGRLSPTGGLPPPPKKTSGKCRNLKSAFQKTPFFGTTGKPCSPDGGADATRCFAGASGTPRPLSFAVRQSPRKEAGGASPSACRDPPFLRSGSGDVRPSAGEPPRKEGGRAPGKKSGGGFRRLRRRAGAFFGSPRRYLVFNSTRPLSRSISASLRLARRMYWRTGRRAMQT